MRGCSCSKSESNFLEQNFKYKHNIQILIPRPISCFWFRCPRFIMFYTIVLDVSACHHCASVTPLEISDKTLVRCASSSRRLFISIDFRFLYQETCDAKLRHSRCLQLWDKGSRNCGCTCEK